MIFIINVLRYTVYCQKSHGTFSFFFALFVMQRSEGISEVKSTTSLQNYYNEDTKS